MSPALEGGFLTSGLPEVQQIPLDSKPVGSTGKLLTIHKWKIS